MSNSVCLSWASHSLFQCDFVIDYPSHLIGAHIHQNQAQTVIVVLIYYYQRTKKKKINKFNNSNKNGCDALKAIYG